MIKKVIYLSWMPLTDYVSRTWFIDYLIQMEVPVEFWDFTKMLRGDIKEFGEKSALYIRHFGGYSEVEAAISEAGIDKNIFVSLISMDAKTLELYRLISKYGCKTVFVAWGEMPIKSLSEMTANRFARKLLHPLRIAKIAYYLTKKYLYIQFGSIRRFSLLLIAGEQLEVADQFAAKVVSINMSDYETYKDVRRRREQICKERYVVFLDINLPFQSDLALTGVRRLNADEYYASLNRFFELIEDKFDVKVVVASHHKADNSSQRFGGRECYHGKTAELVKDAIFVISHHSTAISFAVLNEKSIVFIYTDEMQKLYENCRIAWIRELASYLDLPTYNVDKITDGSEIVIQPPNRERYDSYKYSYLTSHESQDYSSAEIFLREISAL